MKLTVLLADVVRAAEGKLDLLGANWNLRQPVPSPFAIAVMLRIPPRDTEVTEKLVLQLLDSEGHLVQTSEGVHVLNLDIDVLVQPSDTAALLGPDQIWNFCLNIPTLQLQGPASYRVRAAIASDPSVTEEVFFQVLPPAV